MARGMSQKVTEAAYRLEGGFTYIRKQATLSATHASHREGPVTVPLAGHEKVPTTHVAVE